MTQAKFNFISDANGGDLFTVVSFTGNEAISSLYEYQIELKAPLSAAISLDDVLDSPARFVTDVDGQEHPVYGMLSNFEELQTAQQYVYYRAVLVPRLWGLSIYKTNEIFTQEKTVDVIIETVLGNAGLVGGTDFDLSGLAGENRKISRDYVCQFGESDFDFISRLMENEGIFYYFDHSSGSVEKIIFIEDMNYEAITRPGLIYDLTPSATHQHDCIDAWSCRKQRLAAGVTVRDYNPEHPSVDISGTVTIDHMSRGSDYIYGENIQDTDEATYLSEIRAEERLCKKTRYYGESSVARLRAGFLFEMDRHPNDIYNGVEYYTIEVNHEGRQLDTTISRGTSRNSHSAPFYRNNFVAIDAVEQFRPERVTPKPRFYGTMTAFIYAEGEVDEIAQIDQEGRYRVHLPFDRADGTRDSTDPDRKASTWIRMAQPFVGQEQGMYFPMKGGTEVLLTFINGDPDQPIIASALPNGSQPSLLTSETNFVRNVTTDAAQLVSGNTHTVSMNSMSSLIDTNTADINTNEQRLIELEKVLDPGQGNSYINELQFEDSATSSMLPPWSSGDNPLASEIKFRKYEKFEKDDISFEGSEMPSVLVNPDIINQVSTERSAGDNYVYANARTFAYPQHERVYFIGTFHEDFHVKDDFADKTKSWTKQKEVFHFPAPGGDATQEQKGLPTDKTENDVNPTGVRGVSEDKRWGAQMNYAWGSIYNWGGGPELGTGKAGGVYNYGNGYTENLLEVMGYTVAQVKATPPLVIPEGDTKTKFDEYKAHLNDWTEFVGVRAPNSNLKDSKNLQADTLGCEKTFGNTYSYQMGYAVDIHEGHSHSKTYGDTWEETYGTTDSIYHGAIHEYTMAGKAEFNLAACSAISLAESFELYGGLKQEINLAWAGELFIGSTLDAYLALKQEIGLGLIFELFFAPKFGIGLSPEIKSVKPLKLEAEDAEIKSLQLVLEDTGVMLGRAQCHIGQVQLAVESAGIEIHG